MDGVHVICCDLRGYDLYLHSGKNAVFYMHRLLLYEVGTGKKAKFRLF